MTAIYKKELKGFLTSMIGYVFIAFLLAVCGIYFTAYHLQAAYPKFAYTLSAVLFVFLILVPILTMRVLAEERRQKTDQLLLTSPISVPDIVLGKFFALVTVFLIPVVILAFYPLILSQFGTVSFPEAYTALFGFFLLGSSYLAIGLFLSSVTESQVIAAVLTFFALFISYVMNGISTFFPDTAVGSFVTLVVVAAIVVYLVQHLLNRKLITLISGIVLEGALIVVYVVNSTVYEGLVQDILSVFCLTDHFSEFAGGMFDVQGLIYYLTVMGIFLFLTVQSIQKRRWGAGRGRLKNGSYSMALTAVVMAVCVAVNLVASQLPSSWTEIDITDQQLTVLTDQTKELLADLDQDVTLYYIVQDDNEDTNISRLLNRYEDVSSHISVVQKDPVRYPNFTSQYTEDSLSENSIIVVCGEESKVITYDSMYEYELNYSTYSYSTTGFDAEGQITSAIAAVSSDDLPKVYALQGHGETELSSTLTSSVEKENIQLESLSLLTEDTVPEDADCLLIAAPTSDLTESETNKILSYLMTGGKALIITSYTGEEMTNLNTLLEYYGVTVNDGVVMEGSTQNYVQVPYYLVPTINSTEVSEDLAGGNAYVLMAAAQGLTTSDSVRDTVTVTEVLSTSSSAYSKTDVANMTTYEKESDDIDGPFAIGMLATEDVTLTDELEEQAAALAAETGLDEDTLASLSGVLADSDAAVTDAEEDGTEESTETEETTDGAVESADIDAAESTEEAAEEETTAAAADEETEATETADADETEAAEVSEETETAAEDSTEETTDAEDATEAADSTEDSTEDATEAEDVENDGDADTLQTKVAVYSSAALIDDSANQMVSGGNEKLFVNTLSWMCGHETTVSIPVKSMSVSYLTLTAGTSNFWSVIVIGVLPVAFLGYGLYVWLKRRKK